MSRKTRNLLRLLAIIFVIAAVLMHEGILSIAVISRYTFYIAVTSTVLALIASR